MVTSACLQNFITSALVTCAFASYGASKVHHHHLQKRQTGGDLTSTYPTQNFTMPVDHFHNDSRYAPHTDRTFQNSYWFDDTYYKPGGPIIVNTMGEDGTFDLSWFQAGLLQQLANATGGMAVLWGQRYYAGSYDIFPQPFTTKTLRFHTTEQAMADLAYFAQRAVFAGHENRNLTAATTPWIVIGGSYAGVISAFTRIQYPDLFWGGLQSSGVSVALLDDWAFYDAARRYGPPECIAMQQKIIDIVDKILTSGNVTSIHHLKAAFNATSLSSDHDFALVLSYPFSSGLIGEAEWIPSYYSPISGRNTYCGNLTSTTIVKPVSDTVKADAKAIIADGGWANETSTLLTPFLNFISTIRDTTLFGVCPAPLTLNYCWSSKYASAYGYLGCMESGQFATGYTPGTAGHPPFLPVASRLLNVSWEIENCRQIFNLSSSWQGPEIERWNKYGGFNMSYPRLAISTGEWDVFRSITPLAADISYGVPNPRLQGRGTKDSPEAVIAKGGHEWDLQGVLPKQKKPGVPPPQVVDVKHREIETVKGWLQEWDNAHKS